MSVKLLTEHHLEFLSLKGVCTGSSESTLVKCHIVGNNLPQLISKSEQRFLEIKKIYLCFLIYGVCTLKNSQVNISLLRNSVIS